MDKLSGRLANLSELNSPTDRAALQETSLIVENFVAEEKINYSGA
jgi:hypothetical protein